MSNEIAVREKELPDRQTVKDVLNGIEAFRQVLRTELKKGRDYDVIVFGQKPSLLKSGAEKIISILSLSKKVEVIEKIEDYEKCLFSYTVRCILYKGDRQVEGIGTCNSKEKKMQLSKRKDGSIPTEEEQKQYTFNIVNTILKMASKRAMIDAILNIATLSELFTQDLEDYSDKTETQNKHSNNTPKQTTTTTNNSTNTNADNKNVYGALRQLLMKDPETSENFANILSRKEEEFDKYLYEKMNLHTLSSKEAWEIVYILKEDKNGKKAKILNKLEKFYNEYVELKNFNEAHDNEKDVDKENEIVEEIF